MKAQMVAIDTHITALAARGLSRRAAADALGWPYVTFCKRVRRWGLGGLFKAAEWQARSAHGAVLLANNKERAREKAKAHAKLS